MKRPNVSNIIVALICLFVGRCTSEYGCPRVVARTTTTPSPSGLVADNRVTAGDSSPGG
jgi:hypothetical protein